MIKADNYKLFDAPKTKGWDSETDLYYCTMFGLQGAQPAPVFLAKAETHSPNLKDWVLPTKANMITSWFKKPQLF